MKFARHLLAVVVVLAVVCGVALIVGHGAYRPSGNFPNAQHVRRIIFAGSGKVGPNLDFGFRHFDSGSHGLNWSSVIQTVILGSAIAALVVGVDLAARGRRRRAKAAQRTTESVTNAS